MKFGTSNANSIKNEILNSLEDLDLRKVINDLKPFIIKPEDAEKTLLFRDFLRQVEF